MSQQNRTRGLHKNSNTRVGCNENAVLWNALTF